MPSTYGSASGLRSSACIMTPGQRQRAAGDEGHQRAAGAQCRAATPPASPAGRAAPAPARPAARAGATATEPRHAGDEQAGQRPRSSSAPTISDGALARGRGTGCMAGRRDGSADAVAQRREPAAAGRAVVARQLVVLVGGVVERAPAATSRA